MKDNFRKILNEQGKDEGDKEKYFKVRQTDTIGCQETRGGGPNPIH